MSANSLPHMMKDIGDAMNYEQAMENSLHYERAFSWMTQIIHDLHILREDSNKKSEANNERPDASLYLILKDFERLQKEYRQRSDEAWKIAERNGEWYQRNCEDLANSIIAKAFEDYEIAISGINRNESEIMLIEKFAELCDHGDVALTTQKIKPMLKRVDKAHEVFVMMVNEHKNEIISETKEKQENRNNNMENNKYRCPLCGGGLYAQTKYGITRIVCTHCYLSEVVKAKKKGKKSEQT